MTPSAQRPMLAEDLYRILLIQGIDLSPDGGHVVYAVQRIDRKTEKKHANLWLVPTEGGDPQPFTQGDHTDSRPRWSPDGTRIAFLSNRADEKQSQLYWIPFGGGEARRLTSLKGEFGAFAWSPDGTRIACQFRQKDQEALDREADETRQDLGVVARHVTRPFFKLDAQGYLPQERWHLWVIDVPGGRATQITRGDVWDETAPCWSPEGSSLAFISNRSPQPDLDPDTDDLFVVPASGGEARRIDTPLGPKAALVFSPDGRWIAYLGHEGRGDWWKNNSLWVVPVDGGQARNLTDRHDLHVDSHTSGDMGEPAVSPPAWSPSGERIYFQVDRHGSTHLYAVSPDGSDLQAVVDDPGAVRAFRMAAQDETLAYPFSNMEDPGNLRAWRPGRGQASPLTHLNHDWLQEVALGQVEEAWVQGPAGNALQGWILKPPSFDPSQTYPSILEIHGGPLVQYGHAFMHEFQVLAGQGYVVHFCNPRGGQGYGEDHARAIWHAWGTVDYEDLMAWTDHVAAQPYIDPTRMGVAGGSYGGYMTNWIIGHTDRFAAAVTQRSVSNLLSFWGSSDFNWVFQEPFGGSPPWEAFERYWEMSPMKHIGNARTPTLVIHSESDHRTPIEQGEQVFVALQRLGVESEMVRFPDEPHGLSRAGRTDRRVARLEHIRRWFDRHLKLPPERTSEDVL